MPFWGQSEDPPTSMICGFKKEDMLIDPDPQYNSQHFGLFLNQCAVLLITYFGNNIILQNIACIFFFVKMHEYYYGRVAKRKKGLL